MPRYRELSSAWQGTRRNRGPPWLLPAMAGEAAQPLTADVAASKLQWGVWQSCNGVCDSGYRAHLQVVMTVELRSAECGGQSDGHSRGQLKCGCHQPHLSPMRSSVR